MENNHKLTGEGAGPYRLGKEACNHKNDCEGVMTAAFKSCRIMSNLA